LETGQNPSNWRWHMSQKTYFLVCGAVFFAVAMAHIT